MAYLVRDARSRSPYWYGVYLVVSPGGQRRWVRKSTKKRKRSEAKEILDAWQNTADRAAAGNLDRARIREIVLETVSFRSLRHTFNSAMANADVPPEIRQKLTGHASQDMNKHYTHLELETVRRAVESISRLPANQNSSV
jgi:integrase